MSLSAATRSEVTKQFSTVMWWVLALILLVYVGSTAAGLGFVFSASATGALPGEQNGPTPDAATLAPILYSLAASLGYVFPLLIGTLMVTSEFRHKTLTPTFLAVPRRGTALWAKVLVGILMGAIFGVVAVVATLVPSAALLAGFGLDTALSSADTWTLVGRCVVALAIWVLIGIGVGTLVRNQVAAVVIVLAFTQFIEPIARTAGAFVDGLDQVTRYLPGAASDALVGSSIFAMGTATTDSQEWWGGGAVLLGYAVLFLVLGYLFSWRRDVT